MTTVYEVLDRLRSLAIDEHDKGKRFERLIQELAPGRPTNVFNI